MIITGEQTNDHEKERDREGKRVESAKAGRKSLRKSPSKKV
jgi:hypothetical protein